MFSALEAQELNIVIDAMDVKQVHSGDTIIRQGEDGDVLYVIGSGQLECTRKNKDSEDQIFLKNYEAGDTFGELALLYNCPRAATIVAKTDATLYTLDRNTFNVIVKEQAQKKREAFEEALKKVKILNSMSSYERTQIADAVKTETYSSGDTIIREGDTGNKFYMIMEGSAQAIKQGHSVMDYSAGDYFGERALLKNETRAATVVAKSTPTKCMVLDRRSFVRMLGPVDEILM